MTKAVVVAVVAVLFAVVTVLVGVIALGDVVADEHGAALRRLAATHVAIALTGVAVLLIALVEVSQATAWVSVLLLVVAGSLGLATLARTRRPYEMGQCPSSSRLGDADPDPHNHQSDDGHGPGSDNGQDLHGGRNPVGEGHRRVPSPVVVIHGAAAVFTILLVLLALSSGALRTR